MHTGRFSRIASQAAAVALAVAALSFGEIAGASDNSVPQNMNFQGNLTDPNGDALSGTYDIRFSLYVSGSSTPFWLADYNQINVVGGIFFGPSRNLSSGRQKLRSLFGKCFGLHLSHGQR